MLKIESYSSVANGYYFVKLNKNIEVDSGFDMPDESSELAIGEIVLSGHSLKVNKDEDLLFSEFNQDDKIIFKRHTGFTVEVSGEKYKIIPHDSVLLSI